jgi:hypothetical protein
MEGAKLRLAGYLTLALGVAVGGGYGWARTVHMPRIVEIRQHRLRFADRRRALRRATAGDA